ncbi:unnamed protein product, partial [Allacma fusca]
MLKLTATELRR